MLKNIKLIAIIAMLVIIVIGLTYKIFDYKKEQDRIHRNQEILLAEKDSTIKSLELDKQEIKTLLSKDNSMKSAIIDSMKIKIKDLEYIVKLKSKTQIKFKTILKDTTIFVRDTIIKYEYFHWEDKPWVSATGIVYQDTILGDVQALDTIYVGTYIDYKGWFFPRWFGTPVPCADVENVNPYVTIYVVQSIKQKKKKK